MEFAVPLLWLLCLCFGLVFALLHKISESFRERSDAKSAAKAAKDRHLEVVMQATTDLSKKKFDRQFTVTCANGQKQIDLKYQLGRDQIMTTHNKLLTGENYKKHFEEWAEKEFEQKQKQQAEVLKKRAEAKKRRKKAKEQAKELERKQEELERKQEELERKQEESMLAGLAAEKDALETLSLIHTIEDRSTWAANWQPGTESWDKPYAMDFYFPDRRTAVDIKFKTLNQQYQSFALDKDHYDKYQVYIDTYPDVNKGILWYIERTSKREYLLEMDHMKNCIERGMIQLRAGHKDYIRKGSSGQYYAIPLDCFKDITDEEWSVTGIKKRDSAAANPFTKL